MKRSLMLLLPFSEAQYKGWDRERIPGDRVVPAHEAG